MITKILLVQIEPKNGFETEKVKKGYRQCGYLPQPSRLAPDLRINGESLKMLYNFSIFAETPERMQTLLDVVMMMIAFIITLGETM